MDTTMNDATKHTQPRMKKSRRSTDEIFRRGYWHGVRHGLGIKNSPLEPEYQRVLALPEGEYVHA